MGGLRERRSEAIRNVAGIAAACLALLGGLPCCSPPDQPNGSIRTSASVHECAEGAAPLDVVVADLVVNEDPAYRMDNGFYHMPDGEDLLAIDASTVEAGYFLTAFRVPDDMLDAEQYAALVSGLVANNHAPEKISLRGPIEGAVVRDSGLPMVSNNPLPVSVWQESWGDLRGRVSLWAPAVSMDGTRALVRFSFGPTTHGATGTYLLGRCDGGGWRILWTHFIYYL